VIEVRLAAERGRTTWDWLDSRHTFSFGEYHDPAHMGFRALRVINDDRVRPGAGFGTHGHRDMEILSYVLEGALEHKDSAGGGGVIRPGEIQLMRAGRGVTHSEFNHSKVDPVHFLQIWIVPAAQGLVPSYEQKTFPVEDKRDVLKLVASGRDDAASAVRLHQDVDLLATVLSPGASVEHTLAAGRHGAAGGGPPA